MAKNIVVCSDGTGNSAVKGRGTNVFKMFEAIDLNGHRFDPALDPQVAIYDDGVGTEDFKPLKIFAGATGYGLSRNVRRLYKELCRVYDPGDRIFLFGFSRGAFTVRTLAGLIMKRGIIDVRNLATAAALERAVRIAYKAYRRGYRTLLAQLLLGPPKKDVSTEIPSGPYGTEVRIAFIGVWDTVDAVGLPFHLSDVVNTVIYRFKFPDRKLSDRVERAYHALAIDDERHSFHPLLWEQGALQHQGQLIEQVWFAGAHANVGGGYPKQGMSLVALDWMMQKAGTAGLHRAAGLRFIGTDRALYRERANVDDKLYDPRSGLGVFYRWKPRDIAAISRENGVAPAVHLSVLERIAHGTADYGPGNLAPDTAVVFTPTGETDKDASAALRAAEVEAVFRAAHSDGQPLLARVGTEIVIGRVSYYVYLITCIVVLLAASVTTETGLNPWLLLKSGGGLLLHLTTHPLDAIASIFERLALHPRLMASLAAGFLMAYAMQLYTDLRMSAVFSQFWHDARQQLRDGLKRARRAAAGGQADATTERAHD
jgi:hypothetical protein